MHIFVLNFIYEFNSREMEAVFYKSAISYMQLCQLLRIRSLKWDDASRIITSRDLGRMWDTAS